MFATFADRLRGYLDQCQLRRAPAQAWRHQQSIPVFNSLDTGCNVWRRNRARRRRSDLGPQPLAFQLVKRKASVTLSTEGERISIKAGKSRRAICGRMSSMLFLVQYDRRAGRIVSLKSYANDQRVMARKARLDLEIELQRHRQNHEVVLLEAASEEALRKTHGRYFEDVGQLLAVAIGV